MDKHNHIYVPKHNEEILTPFGPAVGYKKLSSDFVKFLNKNLDDNLEDFSNNLVGKVKEEKQFSPQIIKHFVNENYAFIMQYYNACLQRKLMDSEDLPNDVDYNIQVSAGWYVRQYAGEYNPLHMHTRCSYSCVGYLSVPEKFEEESKEDYKDHYPAHGHLQFTNGPSASMDIVGFMVKPRVGDFFIFPSSLLHCVYPFYCEGERRSFSVNFDVVPMPKGII